MTVQLFRLRPLMTLSAIAALAASLAACATKPPPPAAVASTPQKGFDPNGLTDDGPPRQRPPEKAPVEFRPLPGSPQDFVVSAGDRVFFDYDQYTIRDDGRGVLDRQAQWLQRYSNVSVRIEGNADERGTREYNMALGARRAEAVKAYLAGHGVADARLSTISYGKERPIDGSGSEEGQARNRNGHTAIVSGAASQ